MKVHDEHKSKAPKFINLALVVVSTSRFKEIEDKKESSDKTIPLVEQILNEHNLTSDYISNLGFSQIIADSAEQIDNILIKLMRLTDIDSIIFSGGTGLSFRDITYETLEPKLEKIFSGFGELFRSLSYNEIGSSAMLSRAIAGVLRSQKKNKVIFLLPGSPDAVKLALEKLILPELGHILYIINKKE